MAKYTVQNPQGKKVTFEWTQPEPPTDADMEEVFAAAGSVSPSQSPQGRGATGSWDETKAEPTMTEALLPSNTAARKSGGGILQRNLGMMSDLSSGLLRVPRAAAATLGSRLEGKPQSFKTSLDQINRGVDENEEESLISGMVKDPATLPSFMVGGPMTTFGKAAATGLKAGLVSAGAHQADEIARTGKANLGEAAGEIGINTSLPGALKIGGVAAKLGNKWLGKLAEGLSGVSEEALRIHGTGFGLGAKELADAAGKQREIGVKLADALDNLDNYLPEKQIVDAALPNMPPVNIKSTIASLNSAKTGGVLKSSRDVNGKIDEVIADLTSAANNNGDISAVQFREIRKEIDGLIGDAFGKESNKYVSALKNSRHQMALDLVDAAKASGNPQYVEAMQSMADKLQKADKLSSFLGKNATTRDNRAESFISTLFGKNKAARQEAVGAMGQIFGDDFLSQAKLSNLAAELGPEGKAGLLPRQFTGRAALGPGLAALGGNFIAPGAAAVPLALSSPRIAAATLSASDAAMRGLGSDAFQLGALKVGQTGARNFFGGLEEEE